MLVSTSHEHVKLNSLPHTLYLCSITALISITKNDADNKSCNQTGQVEYDPSTCVTHMQKALHLSSKHAELKSLIFCSIAWLSVEFLQTRHLLLLHMRCCCYICGKHSGMLTKSGQLSHFHVQQPLGFSTEIFHTHDQLQLFTCEDSSSSATSWWHDSSHSSWASQPA